MEPVGAISEGAWSSFNGLCSEEADFMAQLLGNCSLPNEVQNGFVWPAHESIVNIYGIDDSTLYATAETNINMNSFSQGSRIYNEGRRPIFFPSSSHESYYPTVSHQFFVNNNTSMTMDYSLMESKNNISRPHFLNNNAMEGDDFLNQDVSNDSVESNGNMPEDILQGINLQVRKINESPMTKPSKGDNNSRPSEISKKRPLIPGEVNMDQRNTRSMKLKKCLKIDNKDSDDNNVNTNNAGLLKQSSSSCCSEDESNASHELNGVASSSISKGSGALNSNGKTRASRGSATDPQSLYARKRRERINERFKILQNLVPNGTKVDISTMLEEAVQYVKFLQLQIKLLSSDDLWMYAPIAYNGMDIGLDLNNITSPKSQS